MSNNESTNGKEIFSNLAYYRSLTETVLENHLPKFPFRFDLLSCFAYSRETTTMPSAFLVIMSYAYSYSNAPVANTFSSRLSASRGSELATGRVAFDFFLD